MRLLVLALSGTSPVFLRHTLFQMDHFDVYSEAKVVLMVRDSAENWKKSVIKTVLFNVGQSRDMELRGKVTERFALDESQRRRLGVSQCWRW